MAGTLIADTLTASSGNSASMDEVTQGCAKAWINFNGTGTPAVVDSFNVTSITDVAVGAWDINLTTAMPNATYAILANNGVAVNPGTLELGATTKTTSAFRIQTMGVVAISGDNRTAQDRAAIFAAIFGD